MHGERDFTSTEEVNTTFQEQMEEQKNIVFDLKNTMFLRSKLNMEFGFQRAKTISSSKLQLKQLRELGTKNYKERDSIEEKNISRLLNDDIYEESESPSKRMIKNRHLTSKEISITDVKGNARNSILLQKLKTLKNKNSNKNINNLPEFIALEWLKKKENLTSLNKFDSINKKKNFKDHLIGLMSDQEVVSKLENKINLQRMIIKLSQDETQNQQIKNQRPIQNKVVDQRVHDTRLKDMKDYFIKKEFVRSTGSFTPQQNKFSFKEEFSRQFENQNIDSALKNFLKNSKSIQEKQLFNHLPFALRNFSAEKDYRQKIPILVSGDKLNTYRPEEAKNLNTQIRNKVTIPKIDHFVSRNDLQHQKSAQNFFKQSHLSAPDNQNVQYNTHRINNNQHMQMKLQLNSPLRTAPKMSVSQSHANLLYVTQNHYLNGFQNPKNSVGSSKFGKQKISLNVIKFPDTTNVLPSPQYFRGKQVK